MEEAARFDLEITAAEAILGFTFEDDTSYHQACLFPVVHAIAPYVASFLEARSESGESRFFFFDSARHLWCIQFISNDDPTLLRLGKRLLLYHFTDEA